MPLLDFYPYETNSYVSIENKIDMGKTRLRHFHYIQEKDQRLAFVLKMCRPSTEGTMIRGGPCISSEADFAWVRLEKYKSLSDLTIPDMRTTSNFLIRSLDLANEVLTSRETVRRPGSSAPGLPASMSSRNSGSSTMYAGRLLSVTHLTKWALNQPHRRISTLKIWLAGNIPNFKISVSSMGYLGRPLTLTCKHCKNGLITFVLLDTFESISNNIRAKAFDSMAFQVCCRRLVGRVLIAPDTYIGR